MADSGQPSFLGRTVNSFQILEKLGAGGFGVVYKARDLKLDRIVALKFLPADVHSREEDRSQFFKEARAASALDHPNVGTIYGIEESAEGQPFIVMAYYDGETLARRIRRAPILPAQAISIAIDMAHGLAEAHAHNIVHRDIKPGNTIITTKGRTKIVDFGLARILQSATSTQSAAITGTAAYMSPEQALGRHSDQRTDVWSLGVVLYEMLNCRLPFPGDNVPGILFNIANSAPAPMEEVPRELQQVVYRALAKDPAQRYQSASEMASDLEALLPGGADAGFARTVTIKDFRKYVESASQSILNPVVERSTWRRWWPALLAVPLLAAAALFLMPSLRPHVGPAEKHIVVLPFTNAGNNPANQALVDGLLESLTGRLSNLDVGNQSLWVVPASEVRGRKVADAGAARREFGANLVVSGSVLRDAQNVQLTVNLIDAKTLRQLGSGVIEDRTGDLSALQNDAVSRLANLMGIRVNADMLRDTGGAVKPAAYESYLKGLGALQRYDKPGNIDAAIHEFESAAAADPRFALAFAGLGEGYLLKYKVDQNTRWFDQATANCERAVQLNDHLAPVYVTLGRIHNETGKQDLALQEFDHALRLEPRNADALFGQAGVYENLGRLKEAEETFQRAGALRPDYWDGYSKLGLFYIRQREFAKAVVQLRRVIQLTPDNGTAWLNLGVALRNENKDEAIDAYRKSLELAPSYAAYANLATVYYVKEQFAEAAPLYAKALELNGNDYRIWINYANVCTRLGQDQKAAEANRRALPLLEKVAKLKPQDAAVQAALALLYATLHERDKAMPQLGMVAALASDDRDIMIRLAEAYEHLGDRAKAVAWLNQALQHGSTLEKLQKIPELRPVLADPKLKPVN